MYRTFWSSPTNLYDSQGGRRCRQPELSPLLREPTGLEPAHLGSLVKTGPLLHLDPLVTADSSLPCGNRWQLTAIRTTNPCQELLKQREEQACRDRVIRTAVGKHRSSWSTVTCKARKRLEGPTGAEEVEPLERVSGKWGEPPRWYSWAG